jgi:DNA-binding PadR family transcriptional regulator
MSTHSMPGPWQWEHGHHHGGFPFDPSRLAAMAGERGHGRRGRPGRGGRHSGFGFPGPGFGRGPRVGRGDVRSAVLALLAEQPMHGYQMIGELAERSDGEWRPSPGSIYPVLQLLADEGLVRAEESEGRRVFHLTDSGRAYVEARADQPKPWEAAAASVDDGVSDLRSLTFQVGQAVRQVAHAGGDRQIAAAHQVLADTRRALYRILAEDEPGEDEPGE